ncbi:hypothetical protein EV182_003706 [Spiromyces aspiralis]|uniref:Uncharacterized protein n=1 Tax=Spiromyces aspiralis TaxID=68401 RepID=A0ACC1HJY5_9FUNG|nr:hypothetical protein EV182_003706 [Spiromyces aspiralis]
MLSFGYIATLQSQMDHIKKTISEREGSQSLVKIVGGIARMHEEQFDGAARLFSEVESFVATQSRDELIKNTLSNSDFKQFLETNDEAQELVESYCDARYRDTLNALERIKNKYRTDPLMYHKLDTLVKEIRTRTLLSYICVYSKLDIRVVNEHLRWSPSDEILEQKLADLIRKGDIHGRIDGDGMILHVYPPDPRQEALEKLKTMTPQLERQLDLLRTRVQLIREGHYSESQPAGDDYEYGMGEHYFF